MAQFRCLLMVTSFLLGYARSTNSDYLLQGITSSAHATITSDDTSLTLSNGLISRVFSLPKHPGQLMQCKPWYCSKWCNTAGKWGCGNATPPPPFDVECSCNGCNGCPGAPPVLPPISAGFPAFATIDLLQLAESPAGLHKSALRSFSPEAVITLDNITYPVGGFQTFNNTSPNLPSNYATNSFLNRSSAALVERACILPGAFIYTGHTTAPERLSKVTSSSSVIFAFFCCLFLGRGCLALLDFLALSSSAISSLASCSLRLLASLFAFAIVLVKHTQTVASRGAGAHTGSLAS